MTETERGIELEKKEKEKERSRENENENENENQELILNNNYKGYYNITSNSNSISKDEIELKPISNLKSHSNSNSNFIESSTSTSASTSSSSANHPQHLNLSALQIARLATTTHGIPTNTTTNHLHPNRNHSPHQLNSNPNQNPNPNGNDERNQEQENEAVAVRRNLLRGVWAGFGAMGRGRKYVLIMRIAIALAQIAAGITALSLPTSLGDSFARPEICDPEGMFVFLTLHISRVICCLPLDIYLGLSPHRNSRQRRIGSQGQEERERNRLIGSLILDRKFSRLSDLLGFLHVVLFVVGNYLVYSSTECSKQPADSIVLFWTSFSMLAISYFVILEMILLVFAVVFFLPGLVMILRFLGLGGNLLQNGINPETGKIGIEKVDDLAKLYYFVPLKEEEEGNESEVKSGRNKVANEEGLNSDEIKEFHSNKSRNSLQELRVSEASNTWKDNHKENGEEDSLEEKKIKNAIEIPLPFEDEIDSHIDAVECFDSEQEEIIDSKKITNEESVENKAISNIVNESGKRRKNGWKFWKSSSPNITTTSPSNNSTSSKELDSSKPNFNSNSHLNPKEASTTTTPSTTTTKTSKITHTYPLLPLPSHRSTCPICLEDYKEPSNHQKDKDEDGNDLEPLRFLPCNHALHKVCVDQWLTTVSGRCPVCQKPIINDGGGEEGETAVTT